MKQIPGHFLDSFKDGILPDPARSTSTTTSSMCGRRNSLCGLSLRIALAALGAQVESGRDIDPPSSSCEYLLDRRLGRMEGLLTRNDDYVSFPCFYKVESATARALAQFKHMQLKTRILGRQRTRHCTGTSRPVRARLPPFCELFFVLCPALALLLHANFQARARSFVFPLSTTRTRAEVLSLWPFAPNAASRKLRVSGLRTWLE